MNERAAEPLRAAAEAIAPELTALRRAIHRDPELGLETPRTLAKAKQALDGLPLEWRESGATSGAVALLRGGAGPGRRVLLRGDMDALPLTEETGLSFASETAGRMHACGHDAHTAMLAGAAKLLCARREAIAGEIMFMFQPGEEGFHGARLMIEDGLLDPLPDAAFALHVMPNGPHGVIAGRAGPIMAASDSLEIVVMGRGGHASMPHDAADPLPVACEIVGALQAMITRRFEAGEAAVVTITRIAASEADNVIASTCRMRGTMRSVTPATRARLAEEVERLARHLAQAHGMEAQVRVEPGFPVTVNDAAAVDLAQRVVAERFGSERWLALPRPIMGAEDFAYVLEKVPGAMLFLGAAEEGADWSRCCGLHSPRMHLDERVLPTGSALLAGLAIAVLSGG